MEEKGSSEWQNREKVAAGRAWREILAEESLKLFNFKDQCRQNRLDAAEKFGLWLISTNLVWHLAEDMAIVLLKHAVFWEVCTPQNQECCSSVHCSLPVDHGYDYPWLPQGKRQSFCMASTKSGMNCALIWEIEFIAERWSAFLSPWLALDLVLTLVWFQLTLSPQLVGVPSLLASPALVVLTSLHPPVCGGCFSQGIWGLTLQNNPRVFFPSVCSRLTAEEQLSEANLEQHLKTYTTFQGSGYARSHKILRRSVSEVKDGESVP